MGTLRKQTEIPSIPSIMINDVLYDGDPEVCHRIQHLLQPRTSGGRGGGRGGRMRMLRQTTVVDEKPHSDEPLELDSTSLPASSTSSTQPSDQGTPYYDDDPDDDNPPLDITNSFPDMEDHDEALEDLNEALEDIRSHPIEDQRTAAANFDDKILYFSTPSYDDDEDDDDDDEDLEQGEIVSSGVVARDNIVQSGVIEPHSIIEQQTPYHYQQCDSSNNNQNSVHVDGQQNEERSHIFESEDASLIASNHCDCVTDTGVTCANCLVPKQQQQQQHPPIDLHDEPATLVSMDISAPPSPSPTPPSSSAPLHSSFSSSSSPTASPESLVDADPLLAFVLPPAQRPRRGSLSRLRTIDDSQDDESHAQFGFGKGS